MRAFPRAMRLMAAGSVALLILACGGAMPPGTLHVASTAEFREAPSWLRDVGAKVQKPPERDLAWREQRLSRDRYEDQQRARLASLLADIHTQVQAMPRSSASRARALRQVALAHERLRRGDLKGVRDAIYRIETSRSNLSMVRLQSLVSARAQILQIIQNMLRRMSEAQQAVSRNIR